MKQVLCFGDSNTFGLIPGVDGRYGWGVRWTSIVDEWIETKGYRVIEEGLCGRTTVFDDPLRDGRKGAELLPVLLETHKPVELVILMLGTNDCKTVYDASAEVIGKGIERLLGQIKGNNPKTRILLLSPIALGDGVWEEGFDTEFNELSVERSKKLPKVYEKIARENNIDFLAASDYAEPSETDREHLNEEGHRRLAEGIIKKLETML